jgi:hypothetical protein
MAFEHVAFCNLFFATVNLGRGLILFKYVSIRSCFANRLDCAIPTKDPVASGQQSMALKDKGTIPTKAGPTA